MKAPFLPVLFLAAVAAAHGQSAEELIRKGDVPDRRFEAQQALAIYEQAEQLDPSNADLQVRIARQYRHLMTDASNNSRKLELGAQAIEHSKRAAQLAPRDPTAQIDPAITYGKMAPLLSGGDRVDASRAIKRSVDATLALDSRNDTAWHILGRWQAGLAEITGLKRSVAQLAYGNLPTATDEEAAKSFARARSIDPSRLMHSVELGRTTIRLGRTAEGKKLIEQGLRMPNREKDDPATKARGRDTLGDLR